MKLIIYLTTILVAGNLIIPRADAKSHNHHKARKVVPITFTEQDLRHSRELASEKLTSNDPEFAAAEREAQREKASREADIPNENEQGVF